jgi:hypothetical protein
MASKAYIQNRWNTGGLRKRPQAIAFSDNYGVTDDGLLVPDGSEFEDFIILSDDNRSEIGISATRIENRRRMINGTMRSYYIADKSTYTLDWQMLPSRSFNGDPNFSDNGIKATGLTQYTSDGGAGGVELVKWYEDHPGPFYMFLAYDRYDKFTTDQYNNLAKYNDVVEVYFSSFEHNVVRRGGSTYDFWNISLSLEEV